MCVVTGTLWGVSRGVVPCRDSVVPCKAMRKFLAWHVRKGGFTRHSTVYINMSAAQHYGVYLPQLVEWQI